MLREDCERYLLGRDTVELSCHELSPLKWTRGLLLGVGVSHAVPINSGRGAIFFSAIYRCFIRRGAHSKHDQDEVIMDNASKSKMPGSCS